MLLALAHLHPLLRPGVDVLGDGLLAADMERQARNLGLAGAVRFLGTRSPEWVQAEVPHYQGAVVPGTDREDGAAAETLLALTETMAMRRPVAAIGVADIAGMVADCGVRLVRPGDIAGLADAVVWLAGQEPAERAHQGAAARAPFGSTFTLRHRALA